MSFAIYQSKIRDEMNFTPLFRLDLFDDFYTGNEYSAIVIFNFFCCSANLFLGMLILPSKELAPRLFHPSLLLLVSCAKKIFCGNAFLIKSLAALIRVPEDVVVDKSVAEVREGGGVADVREGGGVVEVREGGGVAEVREGGGVAEVSEAMVVVQIASQNENSRNGVPG